MAADPADCPHDWREVSESDTPCPRCAEIAAAAASLPDRIWLQIEDDGEALPSGSDGRTHCADRINASDVEYVRAPTVATPATTGEDIERALRDLANQASRALANLTHTLSDATVRAHLILAGMPVSTPPAALANPPAASPASSWQDAARRDGWQQYDGRTWTRSNAGGGEGASEGALRARYTAPAGDTAGLMAFVTKLAEEHGMVTPAQTGGFLANWIFFLVQERANLVARATPPAAPAAVTEAMVRAAFDAYIDADREGDSRFTLDRDLLRAALAAASAARGE